MSGQFNENFQYRILTDSFDAKTGSLIDFSGNESILIDNLKFNYISELPLKKLNLTEYNYLKHFEPKKRLKKLQLLKNCYKLAETDKIYIKDSILLWTIDSVRRIEENIEFKIFSSDGVKTIYIEDIKSILKCNTKFINTFQRIRSISRERYSDMRKFSESYQGYLNFVEDKFLSNLTNITENSSKSENDTFKENELIEIENEIFGRIFCIIKIMNIQLACIKINDKIEKKLKHLLDQILFSDKLHIETFRGIIVKVECLKKFKYKFYFDKFDRTKSLNSIKFEEEYNSEIFTENDLIKYSTCSIFYYGKVIKSTLLNNEKCVYVLPICPTESDTILVQEQNAIKIHQPHLEMKYYQRTILSPYPILEIVEIEKKKIQINDIVDFTLGYSLKKLVGTVFWTGKLNNIPIAVINLVNDSLITEKSSFKIDVNTCQNFNGLNFEENCNLYIVPLSFLTRPKHEEFREVIKYLLQSSEQSSNNALKVAINMRNEKILPLLITKIEEPVQLKSYPEILQLLFKRKQFDIIEILLNKSKSSYKIDSSLLNIAYEILKLKQINLFQLCVSKCKDVNTEMDDGEIFLTKVIKKNFPLKSIIEIIKMDLFNLISSNHLNETPLSLICDKLMSEAIRAVVNSKFSDTSYFLIELNKVLMKNNKDSSIEEKDKIIEVALLLSSMCMK